MGAGGALVDCAVYLDGTRLPGTFTPISARNKCQELQAGFVWIGLHEPDEHHMHAVAEAFALHELAVEDAVHAHQRPKLERYDDTLFLVLKTVNYVARQQQRAVPEIVETGEIMIFVGADFVVTVRHGDFTGLAGVRADLSAEPERLRRGPYEVMHAIADHVVDTYIDVTNHIGADIDAMEERVFTTQRSLDIEPIYFLKREIIELRRAVNPLAEALQLLTSDHAGLYSKDIKRYLRNVIDHHTHVADRISSYDEALTSLIQAAVARITVQQSSDMRRISAYVAIAAVPTAIAAIYGMNFEHMPELNEIWGYPAALGLMGGLSLLLYTRFRHNNWL